MDNVAGNKQYSIQYAEATPPEVANNTALSIMILLS